MALAAAIFLWRRKKQQQSFATAESPPPFDPYYDKQAIPLQEPTLPNIQSLEVSSQCGYANPGTSYSDITSKFSYDPSVVSPPTSPPPPSHSSAGFPYPISTPPPMPTPQSVMDGTVDYQPYQSPTTPHGSLRVPRVRTPIPDLSGTSPLSELA
jgi:hypothetical protein